MPKLTRRLGVLAALASLLVIAAVAAQPEQVKHPEQS